MHDPRWAAPLSDSDATDLLAGRVPSARPDLADLADTVSRLQATFATEPVPSQALATVLAGGALTEEAGHRAVAGRLRRRAAAAVAATVAAVLGLGVVGALPAAAQEAFDRVVGAVVPLPDRSRPPEQTAPADSSSVPVPTGPTPETAATGETASGVSESRDGDSVGAPPISPDDTSRPGDAGPRGDEGSTPAVPEPDRPNPPAPGGGNSGTSGSDHEDPSSGQDDDTTDEPDLDPDADDPSDKDADDSDADDKDERAEPEDPDKADEPEEGEEARDSPDDDRERTGRIGG